MVLTLIFSTTFHIYEKGIQLMGGHAGKIQQSQCGVTTDSCEIKLHPYV